EDKIKLAKEYQQYYYESLPDWFQYDSDDYEIIRHKIGYALFGIPEIVDDTEIPITSKNDTSVNNKQNSVCNKIVYDKTMCKVIDTIYQQIIKFGRNNANNTIYLGIIFNVGILHAALKQSNKKDDKSNEESNNMFIVPIFKLKTLTLDVSYIDNEGRLYKTWKDYTANNRLPQCTMILPKGGLYRYDPNYEVTEHVSTVWVEVLNSPACNVKNKVFKGIDIAANTMSVATAGLGTASLLTPIAPVVFATGLISGSLCGGWNIARNSQKLMDLAKHKQSISPINKNAFPAWLEIGSTALSLGASGGTMILSKALAKGSTVGVVAKTAYNSVILSNLTLSSVGIVYQGYCLIDKYRTKRDVDFLDIVIFASHVLFFGNALLNVKLAGELIETSKGSILEEFKGALKSNRLTEQFNKMSAYVGNTQNRSEGILCKIKQFANRQDFLNSLNKLFWREMLPSIKYQNSYIVINDRIFIDPVEFTANLLTAGTVAFNLISPPMIATERNDVMMKLKLLLKQLLKDYYVDSTNEEMPDVKYFDDILQEMKYLNNAVDVLTKCFKITMIIVEHCNEPKQFLCDAVYFTWAYCKANLKKYNISLSLSSRNNISNALAKIVTFLYDCIEVIGNDLFSAFYAYMLNTKLTTLSS
ncbi:unnamed protein product, partial [Heterotrigona itama]